MHEDYWETLYYDVISTLERANRTIVEKNHKIEELEKSLALVKYERNMTKEQFEKLTMDLEVAEHSSPTVMDYVEPVKSDPEVDWETTCMAAWKEIGILHDKIEQLEKTGRERSDNEESLKSWVRKLKKQNEELEDDFAEFRFSHTMEDTYWNNEISRLEKTNTEMATRLLVVGELVDAANEAIDSDDPGQFLKG